MKRLMLFLAWVPLCAAQVFAPGRYIVELETEPVAEVAVRAAARGPGKAALSGAAARSQKARIRSEQARLRRSIEAEGAAITGQVDTVANALFVRAGEAEAARIAQLPGVLRVMPSRYFHRMLDHALPLHKVPEAWAQAVGGNAGEGVKIAILDSGIDTGHPAFQDNGLSAPSGYPRYTNPSDVAFTNGKVIVARSYAGMFDRTDPDPSARDRMGHGTAAAMVAAGGTSAGPLATITGVAPKAWLGSYKIFGSPGVNESPTDEIVLRAIEDAVADGMDVINLSLGSPVAPAPRFDSIVQAVERAARLGVIVVAAAGNTGPDANTISSPATASSAIGAGASYNDRLFSATVAITGGDRYRAVPGSTRAPASPVTAPVVDVAALDQNGLACSALPAASLAGSIALILRGQCTFEQKLGYARDAGAVGAIVYTHQAEPDPVVMAMGAVTLPAEMVSYRDGLAIKALLGGPVEATLNFELSAVWTEPARIAAFSARGPNVDNGIKPDILAAGTHIYTAAQQFDPDGDVYSSTGFAQESGTSFSSPLVAGAAALVRAARPGLTSAQYRSLLVNSAAAASASPGEPARTQHGGAGVLDVAAALRSTVAASPVSLSFGVGGPDPRVSRGLLLTNVGTAAETYFLTVAARGGGPVPELPAASVQLEPGASRGLEVIWSAAGLAPGEYEGVILVQGAASGVESRIPYWYAVGPSLPKTIAVLYTTDSRRAGTTVSNGIAFRVTDASGVAISDVRPNVTAVAGDGDATLPRSFEPYYPGVFTVNVTLGPRPGANTFRIQAGDAVKEVTITGR